VVLAGLVVIAGPVEFLDTVVVVLADIAALVGTAGPESAGLVEFLDTAVVVLADIAAGAGIVEKVYPDIREPAVLVVIQE
jgi:hypothetical protein